MSRLPPPPRPLYRYVLSHNGLELPNLYSLEHCGLHNNTTVDLHTADVWEGVCRDRLDEGLQTTYVT